MSVVKNKSYSPRRRRGTEKRPDDFSKYEQFKAEGKEPHAIYLAAVADGCDLFFCIRMLRALFGFSIEQAKEVTVTARGELKNLSEHQGKIWPAIKAALESDSIDP